eukprot:CAMPEP_0184301380 /NCGR_PEP_ID=MMETSP1049-20130417/11605_1 /TAXON_ID=77928 /ORGANISM="Proteomonas sulcata, Strain CCMP704" /LENGTH=36 /DNA_ID= /DNA_START= /DNA_END= /DNA_ORIENTATION=
MGQGAVVPTSMSQQSQAETSQARPQTAHPSAADKPD